MKIAHTSGAAVAAVVVMAGLMVLPAIAAPLPKPAPDPYPRIAFVARNDNPFDALGVGAVAGAVGGVIAITPSAALSLPAATVLTEFDPDVVILAGGVGALSTQVEADVAALGPWTVERAAGSGRDETAREVARVISKYGLGRPAMLSTDSGQNVGDLYLGGHLEAESATIDGVSIPQQVPLSPVVWSERERSVTVTYTAPITNEFIDLEIDVPAGGGVIVVDSQVALSNSHTTQPASLNLFLTLDNNDPSDTAAFYASAFAASYTIAGAYTDENEASTSLTAVLQGAVPVTAGTHHVYLRGALGGVGAGEVGLPSMTVTWYPTGTASPIGLVLP